ncbi:MAG: FAD-dependent oxidoreductase [Caldisericia bacterium]|nr:FAD-dependent oxidoreductase [Caldisericia bacterium]
MDEDTRPVGKVLVIGGGVAGVQASLDLAYNGFKTYLVESRDAIGGTMAQLDKTFPTNDCSMCILSPKLVETGSNPNIELLTRSKIIKLEGSAPHFKATVRTEPRFVDYSLCKGCGDCSQACPVLLPNEYEEKLGTKKAISRRYEQAVPSTFGITKWDTSPCKAACPLHVNAHGYIALIHKGEYEKALDLVRERNPFPAITGRVCTKPCEKACTRLSVDESVSIDALKRFVADQEIAKGKIWDPICAEPNEKKIAIIGSGPSGMLCAFDLRLKGYEVSIFEKKNQFGGLLRYGIPAYRLPREILDREIEVLRRMGVQLFSSHEIKGEEAIRTLRRQFDAVFLGTGAWRSKKMNIPGESLPGIWGAIDFLEQVNDGNLPSVHGKVAIVGGGNAAMDCARSVLRLGASESHIIYRRTKQEMPANPEEIEEAMKEGVEFHFLSNPTEIKQDVFGYQTFLQQMELGEPDESGRRKPIPIAGAMKNMYFDSIIMAISQEATTEDFPLIKAVKGLYIVDSKTMKTSFPGVFAGGDNVLGPSTYIEAMACGRKAAISIDKYCHNEDIDLGREGEDPFESKAHLDLSQVIPAPQKKSDIHIPSQLRNNMEEVNHGLSEEDAKLESGRCLNCGGCAECMECVKACESHAVIHEMLTKEQVLEVGSIIVASGFEESDVSRYAQYGLGVFPNVVTSIQFERILSASGPFSGVVTRPSDKKHPKKIAWLQCIGSRDREHPYCSSVCCMYATKEAVIAREHSKEVEATIFYIDIRAFGKEFDQYVERAKNEYGVRYVKSRIASVTELNDGSLKLAYEDDAGILHQETFELVVLSVGLASTEENVQLAHTLGVHTNEFGFIPSKEFHPNQTNQEGIFAAGSITGPMDIPESVTEGSASACMAAELLHEERGKEVIIKEYPPEINVIGDKPRIGVFVCYCGLNIGGYLDVEEVAKYIGNLPNVVYAETNLYTCSSDTQSKIREKIKEYNLNRVVVASCTPRTHEPLFQETIREAGLNRNLFELANIRDQDSWVHQTKREEATEKAKYLVKSAVYRVMNRKPLTIQLMPITRRGLVIGGGFAGLQSALSLANQGFPTYLIEKEKFLGGNGLHIHYLDENPTVGESLQKLIQNVLNHPKIEVYRDSTIKSIDGYVGNFKTTLQDGKVLEHGVVVVATGGSESKSEAYGYGKIRQVVTGRQLEELIHSGKWSHPKSVAFIQCVESRDEHHPYCSRICCQEAVKNSLLIKNLSPETEVYILNRDIRTYGYHELLYKKAREKGVVTIRFEKERKPNVFLKGGNIALTVYDSLLQREIELCPDILVLSTGVSPNPDNTELAKFLKVPLTQDGFFLEAHAKLRPVDFATDGIFLAGLAHSPRNIEETITQARAAAGKACIILSKEGIEAGGKIAYVNDRNCSGCGSCEEICPYKAIAMVNPPKSSPLKRIAEVNASLCKGCGSCASACRSNAIDVEGFSNDEISQAMDALLEPM